MSNCPDKNTRLNALLNKGGIMLFVIEKPQCIYKGMVLLSSAQNNGPRRSLYIKRYDLTIGDYEGGGCDETYS